MLKSRRGAQAAWRAGCVAPVMNLLQTTLALAALLASAPLAAASETYRYQGALEGKDCSGSLTLAKGPRDSGARSSFAVSQRLVLGNEHLRLEGEGRWVSGARLQATLRLRGGMASRVSPLRQARQAPLELTFTLGGGGMWWEVRGFLGQRLWLNARGDQRVAEPGEITIRDGAHGELRGVPFIQGSEDEREIKGNDVRQGQLGNCYLLASLAAVAHFQPERIRGRLRALGPDASEVKIRDRWYRVSHKPVLRQGQPVYARPGDTVQRGGATYHELWPMLFEKAAAASVGGYDSLISGPTWRGLNMLGYRTRLVVCTITPNLERTLTRALAEKRPMVVGFVPMVGDTPLGQRLRIRSSHAYALVAKQGRGFVLRNPWGHSHPTRPLSANDLRKLLASISIAR